MPIEDPTLPIAGSIALMLLGYLLGSIPFGVVFARLMKLGDLTETGSGNIGATNVLRTGNKLAAALTLLMDSGKGAAAVVAGLAVGGEHVALLAGTAAVLGHLFPVWRRFRGGKGVATYLGALVALSLAAGAAACAIWLIVAAAFRYASLASLLSVVASVPCLWALGWQLAVPYAAAMAVLIVWRHSANIKRLRNGTETRIKLV